MTEMTDLDLASITWRLDADAGHWLADDELVAVTVWMADNHLDRATAQHPVIVENGTITYGQDRSDSTVRAPDRDIVTTTVPLRTAPPKVWQPDCGPSVMAELHEAFARHEWSSGFGGVCVDCSQIRVGEDGRLWCHRDDAAPWPCPQIREALSKARIPVPAASNGSQPRRILGDCLNPTDNAKVFGHQARQCTPHGHAYRMDLSGKDTVVMSRHHLESRRNTGHRVIVGWDRPMSTFYALVIDEHDTEIVDQGDFDDRISDPGEVLDLVRPYAVIPPGLDDALLRDADTETPGWWIAAQYDTTSGRRT